MSRLPAVRSLLAEVEGLLQAIAESSAGDDAPRFMSAVRAWDGWRGAYIADELAYLGETPEDRRATPDPARGGVLRAAAEKLRGRVARDPGAANYLRLPDRLEESRQRWLYFGVGTVRTPAEFRAKRHHQELRAVLGDLRAVQNRLDRCMAYFGIEQPRPTLTQLDAGRGPAPSPPKSEVAGEYAQKTRKRSTERGEARAKVIAALTKHHQYDNGSCQNWNPIGNNELATLARVSPSTASSFFTKQFEGYTKYQELCRRKGMLVTALKLLNDEFAPHVLYRWRPRGEGDRDDA